MDPQDGQNSGSGTPVNAPASTQQQQQQQMNGDQDLVNAQSTERMIGKLVDDEVIPTAIVIKNIPFAVQKETLLAIIVSCVRCKDEGAMIDVTLLDIAGELAGTFAIRLQLSSR
jgi:hypothetical protein